MISAIVTTYNRLERLKEAVESVLNQSYKDLELIIVDDHSTDGTKEYLESLTDPRINYIRRNKNYGCDTKPKNQGAKASKGEYLAYLDDDNVWRIDHLQVLMNEIQKDERIDVVYGDRVIITEGEDTPPKMGFTSDFSDTLLMQRNFIDTSDVLMKRSALFDVGGWDERFKKYVDWNLWVRMAKFGKQFRRVPVLITDYHKHAGAKSVVVKDKKIDPRLEFVPEWDPVDIEVELPYLKELREPRVAIFTITYDRLEYTKKSFLSLQETADYPYDHFVVDNGSSDGTVNWLKQRKVILIQNKENTGISKASNQALDAIGKDYDIIMKFDPDCICLTKGWLAAMVKIWKRNHMLGMSPYVSGLKDNPGGAPRVAYGHVAGELVGVTKHLGGICIMTDARAYKEFRWEEDSFLHGVQDMEFSQYLLFNGYRLMYLENYQVSHGPQGTEQQYKDYPEYFERRKIEKTKRYESNGK